VRGLSSIHDILGSNIIGSNVTKKAYYMKINS
jgi:hypothetical protein